MKSVNKIDKMEEGMTKIQSSFIDVHVMHRVMCPNDADGMTNSVDPDQTAPRPWSDCSSRSKLIWVYTVCSDLSVQKFRNITLLGLWELSVGFFLVWYNVGFDHGNYFIHRLEHFNQILWMPKWKLMYLIRSILGNNKNLVQGLLSELW